MIQGARYVTASPMQIAPATLTGEKVRLVPMERGHAEALFEAGRSPEVWHLTGAEPMTSVDVMRAYVDRALTEQTQGRAVPFVTIDRESGDVIGSTRFANVSVPDRRLEIGWTWLRPDMQRTGANSEAKCLMLQHAFDVWGALRVEIKTDELNAKSRAAIERLGATFEGIFRQHMVVFGGRVRNTAYYSIIDSDWRDPSHAVHRLALRHGIVPSMELNA
jgi:RimJ/RimL family protein N-acetyltransferase